MEIVAIYWCDDCLEPYEFDYNDRREEYLCPKCGRQMWYDETEEIDASTQKVVNRYIESIREAQSPKKPTPSEHQFSTPTITCPYCKSTNCKKISGLSKAGSVFMWGIFALGKTMKEWHCNNCNSDF